METIQEFTQRVKIKHDLQVFNIFEAFGYLELSCIIVKQSQQCNNIGTLVLNELIQYSNDTNTPIRLLPFPIAVYGDITIKQLHKFYTNLGFEYDGELMT